jgi:hypothetical protein
MRRWYGSISKLVSILFEKDAQDITLRPNQSVTYTGAHSIDLPPEDADSIIVSETANQAISNKNLDNSNSYTSLDNNFTLQDNGDNTKQAQFNASAISASTVRTFSLPDANTTLVGTDVSQILTNKTISGASNTLSNISLTASVTGTLPIANGGTNSAAALSNNRVIKSAGGAIVEAAAITAARALISDANGIPTHSSVSSAELAFLSGATSNIQAQFDGDKWKQPARAASTANVDISTALEDGDVLDGVTLAQGDRVLLKDQSTGAENGIYIVSLTGAASRAADADESAEFPSMFVAVQEGTANADKLFYCSNDNAFVLDTDTPVFSQFRAASANEVTNAGSSTDNALARFDGTSGKIIQNSAAILDDAGALSGLTQLDVDNLSANGNTISSTDSNGNIVLDPNGTGLVSISAAHLNLASGTSASELRFFEPSGSGSNFTAFKAQAQAGDVTYTLPAADAASSGYVLSSDASGNLSWVSNASSASFKTDWALADGTSKTITHNLGTQDVIVQIYDKADFATIEVDSVVRTDGNTLDLTASQAPNASGWRVMILAV